VREREGGREARLLLRRAQLLTPTTKYRICGGRNNEMEGGREGRREGVISYLSPLFKSNICLICKGGREGGSERETKRKPKFPSNEEVYSH